MPNGYAFAIIAARELPDGSKLLNIRDPFKKVDWDGEWGASSTRWNEQTKDLLQYDSD